MRTLRDLPMRTIASRLMVLTAMTLFIVSDLPAQFAPINPARDNFWVNLWTTVRYPQMQRVDPRNRQEETAWDYQSRAEVDEQSEKYMRQLEQDGAFLDDPQLEDYLTQMLHRVTSHEPIYGRPGTPHIRLLKSEAPNAFALNNGAILVTTGMLALIRSEGELIGVLAHEMAHVVLDHNLENYSSAQSREAFSRFMGTAAAIAAGISASNNSRSMSSYIDRREYVQDAMLIAGTFSYAVVRTALDIVGAAYSRSQEGRADAAARDFLAANGYDPDQYGDLLFRLGEHHRQRGLSMASSLHDDHATIQERLKSLAYSSTREPALAEDASYDRNIAQCLNFNARILIAGEKFALALDNLDRAITSGFALEETYILKARALRYLASDTATNREALRHLDLAAKFKTVGYNVAHLERGLLQYRLGEFSSSEASFREYLNGLNTSTTPGLDEQKTFAQEMILRCRLSAGRSARPTGK